METLIIENEAPIRLAFFLCIFAAMAIWEIIRPTRSLTVPKSVRWANNIGLVVLNTVVLRLLFPAAAVGVAVVAAENNWGLFNYYGIPAAVSFILSVIILDFVIWLQHVMVHSIPLLWRVHRVHHADLDYDLTTGSRFHPVEIVLSMLIKFAAIILLGAPAVAVIVFEVILNGMAMFNHGNVSLPDKLERILRHIIVTPDMHRVHHSIHDDETNSNFGFNLSWWDRMFGTYSAQPRDGHLGMTIGLNRFRTQKESSWLPGMLMLPMHGRVTDYTINRRSWTKPENEAESHKTDQDADQP